MSREQQREVHVSSPGNAWPLIVYPGVAVLAFFTLTGKAAQNKDRLVAVVHIGGFYTWSIVLLAAGIIAFFACLVPAVHRLWLRHLKRHGAPRPDERWHTLILTGSMKCERYSSAAIAVLSSVLEYALFKQYGTRDAVTIQILAYIFGLGGLARCAQIVFEQWMIRRGNRKPPG